MSDEADRDVAAGFFRQIQAACRSPRGEPEGRLRKVDQLCGFALSRLGAGEQGPAVDIPDDDPVSQTDALLLIARELRGLRKWLADRPDKPAS